MDADWTFPTHHDYLDIRADQDVTDINFLEEQDALDAMLWEGLSVPLNEPWPNSQDTMDVGTNSNMDLGCVCDFPPLYCDQHGAYGDMSLEDDLSPPLFDMEQTIASLVDIPELSQPVLGRLALTEKNLLEQSSYRVSSETGRADPSISIYSSQLPPMPLKPSGKPRLRRSKISSKGKRILQAHFSSNPYPDDDELEKLHERTSLTAKCIKTWFVNTRHRTAHRHSLVATSPRETEERQMSETPSQASTSVSAESLKELDRMSPALSTNSLERYLATPLTEDAIPSLAMESLSEAYLRILESGNTEQLKAEFDSALTRLEQTLLEFEAQKFEAQKFEARTSLRATQPRIDTAGSVARSDSSVGSGNSAGSWTSQISVCSRGSRQGRKRWWQATDQTSSALQAAFPKMKGKNTANTKQSKLPWYCTSSDCHKSFRYRNEWERHEAAVHHWPYHWVCNLGEETSSVHKHAESRIFYREDQLVVHMKAAHPGSAATKHSASTLKKDNPDFDVASLRCGFCHQSLRNWEERQNHVADHLSAGMPKSLWLPWKEQVSLRANDDLFSDEPLSTAALIAL